MKPQKRSPLKVGDFMIDIEKIKIIKKDLVKALDPSLIYIFGSISKDKVRKDSDIDIAILTDRQIDEYKLFILSQKLADVLKREIDLVDLNKASTVLKVQIIKTGKLIYNSDNLRKMYFQMRAIRDYALLNEERMEIINKIESRSKRCLNMIDDIVLNKTEIIKKCIKRINEEYENNPENLENYTKQDSITLNIQRACEAVIDLGMHVIAERNLGLPQASRETFEILSSNKIIYPEMSERLKAMVGFRNIAIHNYQKLNLKIIQAIIKNHLEDLVDFSEIILKLY